MHVVVAKTQYACPACLTEAIDALNGALQEGRIEGRTLLLASMDDFRDAHTLPVSGHDNINVDEHALCTLVCTSFSMTRSR